MGVDELLWERVERGEKRGRIEFQGTPEGRGWMLQREELDGEVTGEVAQGGEGCKQDKE